MAVARPQVAGWGLGAALLLMAAAVVLPAVTGWDVRVRWFPPLHAEWQPRVGWGTLPAVVLGAAGLVLGPRLAEALPWRHLLLGSWAAATAWMLALAFVDGVGGVGRILETSYEYLPTARTTTDVPATLREYVSRIPYAAGDRHWPVHIAGHPPGALLFFVALVRLGLGDGVAAGLVVTIVAATVPAAVLVTLRLLGAEHLGRAAAPFLVLGPAAVWSAVSADAVFAAVGAWGVAALAAGAVRRSVAWSAVAGLLLGYLVMMSYGLPLFGILALGVLWLARSWRALPVAALVATGVVLVFAALGFAWWEAFPVLRERYWDGVASRRPPEYWTWANLAALSFSAGPVAGAGLARLLQLRGGRRLAGPARVVAVLGTAGWLMVLAADLSQMSRAEVERIWLPFVPWLLVPCALLDRRWRRVGLAAQVLTALVVQHLLDTGW